MISEVEYHISLMLLAVSAFNTLVVFFLMTFSRNGKSPANRFLILYLLFMAVALFMMFSIRSHLILNYSWLYRVPSPLFYLIFPVAYLYIRMTVLDENKLRWPDLLHTIPALLHLVEYLPYHLLPADVKHQIVESILNDPLGGFGHQEGWLPSYAHNIIRGVLGMAYSVAMIVLLRGIRKRRPEGEVLFPELSRWLWVFSLMLLVFSASLIVILLLPHFFSSNMLAFCMYFWLSATQIVTSLTLLGNPTILYGMPKPLPQKLPVHTVSDHGAKQQDDSAGTLYTEYLDLINRFMAEQKPFLKARYSLNELSRDLGIPDHHISFVLNHLLHTRFSDYMNMSRIHYLEQKVKTEDVSHLSLEGLAKEAGFGSRITFIRAVQRHTGKNPSDFFNVR